MFVLAPLLVGIIACECQLPQHPLRPSTIQFDRALDAVGTAYALTTIALLVVDVVFRSAGRNYLIRWADLAALSVGTWSAMFLALGTVDKHNLTGALIGGSVGAFLVIVAAVVALIWEFRNL
jgi:hypothetical protein